MGSIGIASSPRSRCTMRLRRVKRSACLRCENKSAPWPLLLLSPTPQSHDGVLITTEVRLRGSSTSSVGPLFSMGTASAITSLVLLRRIPLFSPLHFVLLCLLVSCVYFLFVILPVFLATEYFRLVSSRGSDNVRWSIAGGWIRQQKNQSHRNETSLRVKDRMRVQQIASKIEWIDPCLSHTSSRSL